MALPKSQRCTGLFGNKATSPIPGSAFQLLPSEEFLSRAVHAEPPLEFQPSLSCGTITLQAGNHRIPESLGSSSSSHSLPWAGTPFPSPGCSKPYPTWPGIFPGVGSPHLPGNVWMFLKGCSYNHHPIICGNEIFLLPSCKARMSYCQGKNIPEWIRVKPALRGAPTQQFPRQTQLPMEIQQRFLDTAPKHKSKHTHSSNN